MFDGGQPQGDILLLLPDFLVEARAVDLLDVQDVLLFGQLDLLLNCCLCLFRQPLFGFEAFFQIGDPMAVCDLFLRQLLADALFHQGDFGVGRCAHGGKFGRKGLFLLFCGFFVGFLYCLVACGFEARKNIFRFAAGYLTCIHQFDE